MGVQAGDALTEALAVAAARVDWFRVIVELERLGHSHERIAAECMRGKTWAWALKNVPDTEPRYRDGVALLAFWSEQTGKPASEYPRLNSILF